MAIAIAFWVLESVAKQRFLKSKMAAQSAAILGYP